MIYKLKNNRGSAIMMAIILIAITTIVIGTTTMLVLSQIKYNNRTKSEIKAKYISEAGIENTIALAIEQIEYKLNNYTNNVVLDIPEYEMSFDEVNKYKVKQIYTEKYTGFDIISTGYTKYMNDEKSCETIVTVEIKTVKKNNKFTCDYSVLDFKTTIK